MSPNNLTSYEKTSFLIVKNLINIFIGDNYSKPAKKNYVTNATVIRRIDNTWSLDLLETIVYGIKNIKSCSYISVVIDNFSECGWYFA